MKTKKQDPLITLVQSLTTNEKRYFKLSAFSEGKNYQKIFDVIEAKTVNSAKELKLALDHTGMNVSYEKKYLQKLILRSLRNFHEDAQTIQSVLQNMIDLEILFNKQQYDLCQEIIEDNIAICRKHELHVQELHFIKWKRRLFIRRGLYNEVAALNKKWLTEENNCIVHIQNLNEYKDIQAQMLKKMAQKGIARERADLTYYEEVAQNPYLSDISKASSYMAKVLFNETWVWYYSNTLQIEKAYESAQKQVELIEAHPEKIIENPQHYIASLASLANRCSVLNYFDVALKTIEKLEKLNDIKGIKLSKSLQTETLSFVIEKKMMCYTFSRNFKAGVAFYEATQHLIEQNKTYFRDTFFSMHHLLVAICYFYSKDYDQTLKHIRINLDETEDKQRHDNFLYTHMLHIMLQYELKSYELIPYLCKQLQRFAKAKTFQQEIIPLFIKMILELVKFDSDKHVRKVAEKYSSKFELLNKISAESVVIGTLELHYWLASKLISTK